ncbi:hypothetical protein AUC61_14340 [Pseudomonas sp. S25]|uniref:Uncharacterized protein n=1 Tax=Pseudomonas maioricensis TaxID=1766623 RepID=A0ABS9ZJF4_9PSED|nr:DUF4406 domain-containing protein [Pseudomonas sp. S25]MCI8210714.1 hypothetical protein [Pseudomonas sp. S25]
MHRINLCGPMTGLPEYNFPAFAAEAARLRGLGFDVVNHAEINPDGASWEECMRRDVPLLVTCHHVATLPSWDKLQGAQLEVYVADRLGIRDSPAHTITEYQVQPCSGV